MYQLTTATKRIAKLNKRLRGVSGGTSAGKTISILQYLIHLAQKDTEPTVTSITSESLPHLRRGAMRDFLDILKTHNYYQDASWNKSEFTYTFASGSRIEFFSADQPHKVRGPRRHRLFINEANNLPYETFDQLEVRTKEFLIADWNPTNEFWWYSEVMPKRNDFDFITLTYKDNEALAPEIIKSIEQRRNNKMWWRVYGEGQLGEIESRIYLNWAMIDEIPHEARLERYGLDFGYSNDPTAIVAIYRYNGGFIADEVCYQLGMRNKDIADLLKNLESCLTVADVAEPKSIDEIKSYGVSIVASSRGGDESKRQGIQYVQEQRMSVTKRSINLIKEYRNYLWITDKNGKQLNEPKDGLDHALDALRYGLVSIRPQTYEYIPRQTRNWSIR